MRDVSHEIGGMPVLIARVLVALALFIGFVCASTLAAALPTTALEPAENSPIAIDMCAVTLAGSAVSEVIDFHNISDKPVTDVKLYFVFKDVFGGSSFAIHVAHGVYSPGAPIKGVKYVNGAQQPYQSAYCAVGAVLFQDGTKWSAGKGFLAGASASPRPTSSP